MSRSLIRVLAAALGFTAAVCPAAGAEELKVVLATPQGDLEALDREAMDREGLEDWQRRFRPLPAVDRIQILFDRPVVPLSAPDPGEKRPAWLKVAPEIRAHWRWAGPAELIGDIAGEVPRATEFAVVVQKGLKALDGSLLRSDFRFAFQTPRPRVAVVNQEKPRWFDTLDEWIAAHQLFEGPSEPQDLSLGQELLVITDIPVHLASLREALKIHAVPRPIPDAGQSLGPEAIARLQVDDPEGHAGWLRFLAAAAGSPAGEVAFSVEPDPLLPQRVFRLKPPRGRWPTGATLAVQVDEKLRATAGPLSNLPAERSFHTSWPFAPLRVEPRAGAPSLVDAAEASLEFSSPVIPSAAWRHLRWRSALETEWRRWVPEPAGEVQDEGGEYPTASLHLGRLELQPGREYEICLDRGLGGDEGGSLDYPWCTRFQTAHTPARLHLVEGQGVLEWNGPHLVPFSSVNVLSLQVRHRRIEEEELFRVLLAPRFPGESLDPRPELLARSGPETLKPSFRPDVWDFSPLNLDPVLGGKPGVVFSSLAIDEVLPGSSRPQDPVDREPRYLLTQVTSLGLTVKKTPHEGHLIWVTRLGDARPAAGVTVRARDEKGGLIWEGTTGPEGVVEAPPDPPGRQAAYFTARLEQDLAFARGEWHEGFRGWQFNLPVDWSEGRPVTGLVWVDRGIVRPGETVHAKVVLRRRDNRALRPWGSSPVFIGLFDGAGKLVSKQALTLDSWGAGEAVFQVPASAPLGSWAARAASRFDAEGRTTDADRDWEVEEAPFRVAEFRRPKFRVEAAAAKEQLVAGEPLEVSVLGSFLAGGSMRGAPWKWNASAVKSVWRPPGQAWKDYEFLPFGFSIEDETSSGFINLGQGEGTLDDLGRAALLTRPLTSAQGWPWRITAEAEVRDVDRQVSAARASALALPGEFLLGLRETGFFCEAARGIDSAVVALSPAAVVRPGVQVRVELSRRRWDSVRRRTASGRYEFESRPVDTVLETRELTTGGEPVPLHFALQDGGYYQLSARAEDGRGNQLQAAMTFFVLGKGYTPWRMDQANRIDILPEKETYSPGETARVLVQSPWESTLALITVERAGILEHEVRTLTGTMPVIEIPVRPEYTPNVFVSVVLLRGRVDLPSTREAIDPGRPAFRIGMCELAVPPMERRLAVEVAAEKGEYRPGQPATAVLKIHGADGKPRRASVTLWAVDAGVLDLTRYQTPDPLEVFYRRQGLGVSTSESRSRLIGRRSFGVKGGKAGGGGGMLAGDQYLRRDFRALAIWKGDLVTGDDGTARVTFAPPDALTTYRLMAVALAGDEEFGSGSSEFRVSKPIGLEPALPRFLRPGDRAEAGVVLRNRTAAAVEMTVKASCADPLVIQFARPEPQTVSLGPNESKVVRFAVQAGEPGTATLLFTAAAAAPAAEKDAVELKLPVIAAQPEETFAAFFSLDQPVEQAIVVPEGVLSTRGGLTIRLAPSAILEGQRGSGFLAAYPHACAEQLGSRVLGFLAAARLDEGFLPESIDGLAYPEWLARQAERLAAFQKPDGGFAFWSQSRESSPFLSAYIGWVLGELRSTNPAAVEPMAGRLADYLSQLLRREKWEWGESDGWTVKVLASHGLQSLGRAEPAYFEELFARRASRAQWARLLLAATMLKASPRDPRARILLQEGRNAVALGARTARLKEPAPAWGWRCWWAEEKNSATALLAFLEADPQDPLNEKLLAGLLDHLQRDQHLGTHTTAWMLQAIARYREKRESGTGSRTASVLLGDRTFVEAAFSPGDRQPVQATAPIAGLLALAEASPKRRLPVRFTRTGTGPLQGSLFFSYIPKEADKPALDRGIALDRRIVDRNDQPLSSAGLGEELFLEVVLTTKSLGRSVAVTLPLPAGVEAVDPTLATTAIRPEEEGEHEDEGAGWDYACAGFAGFDHLELRDDRVLLYASCLPAGTWTTRVRLIATTPGRFDEGPAKAELMYEPEIFGTQPGPDFEVRP